MCGKFMLEDWIIWPCPTFIFENHILLYTIVLFPKGIKVNIELGCHVLPLAIIN